MTTTARYVKDRTDRYVIWGLGAVLAILIFFGNYTLGNLQKSIDKLTVGVEELRHEAVEIRHLREQVADHEMRLRKLERQ